jgi:hypothetical protein
MGRLERGSDRGALLTEHSLPPSSPNSYPPPPPDRTLAQGPRFLPVSPDDLLRDFVCACLLATPPWHWLLTVLMIHAMMRNSCVRFD